MTTAIERVHIDNSYRKGAQKGCTLTTAIEWVHSDNFGAKDFLIIWFSNILTMSVPDEGYSRNIFLH